jgi:hypothetical protein
VTKPKRSRKRQKTAPTRAVHTLYVRDFPYALTRQVRAAALLRGITINQMLELLVREGLIHHGLLYVDPLAGRGVEMEPAPEPAPVAPVVTPRPHPADEGAEP